MGLARLAVAPIGTERGVFDPERSAAILAEALSSRAAAGETLPTSLVVAVGSPAEAAAYRGALSGLGTPR
jgi:hypothetical protein